MRANKFFLGLFILVLSISFVSAIPSYRGFLSTMVGDVNNDGILNYDDALDIARISAGVYSTPSNFCIKRVADVTNDGRIDILDALVGYRMSLGLYNTGRYSSTYRCSDRINYVSTIMEEGEIRLINLDGQQHTVELLIVSDTGLGGEDSARFRVDGQVTRSLVKGETQELLGVIIGITDIIPNEAQEVAGGDQADLFLAVNE